MNSGADNMALLNTGLYEGVNIIYYLLLSHIVMVVNKLIKATERKQYGRNFILYRLQRNFPKVLFEFWKNFEKNSSRP